MKKLIKRILTICVMSMLLICVVGCSSSLPEESAGNNNEITDIEDIEKTEINKYCGEFVEEKTNDVFKYSVYSSGIQIDGFKDSCKNGKVSIPSVIEGFSVIGIACGAFCDADEIISVEIPGTVKYIGGSAFRRCRNLESVIFSDGPEFIGERVFDSCIALKNIVFPMTVKYVGEYVLALSSVENVSIPTLKEIPAGMYYGTKIKEFSVPSYITHINSSAFAKCENLTDITVPGTVKYIGSTAFANNVNLKTVRIEEGCSELGYGVFEGDKVLADVYFPKSLVQFHASLFPDAKDDVVLHVKKGSKTEEFAANKKFEYVTE